jgi:hypothetical protein
MKTAKWIIIGLIIVVFIGAPVLANAYVGYGGAAFFGFGLGLFTGLAFSPRPVYVGPGYYPPPLIYRSPVYFVLPQDYTSASVPPSSYGYSDQARVLSVSPSISGRCREWRLLDRHLEDRWDGNYGRSQKVLVERFGWVAVSCRN